MTGYPYENWFFCITKNIHKRREVLCPINTTVSRNFLLCSKVRIIRYHSITFGNNWNTGGGFIPDFISG
ncbi:MAG TPA: hypothetical protein DCY12_04885 [Candidatus Atribacteria bacterium]|nr:hypothetical protein [Candidatus Atribacteria bacterium]